MPITTQDMKNKREDLFALGSSQYTAIYRRYTELVDTCPDNFDPAINYRQTLTSFYKEIILAIKGYILDSAKEFDEEPELKQWKSLKLKIDL